MPRFASYTSTSTCCARAKNVPLSTQSCAAPPDWDAEIEAVAYLWRRRFVGETFQWNISCSKAHATWCAARVLSQSCATRRFCCMTLSCRIKFACSDATTFLLGKRVNLVLSDFNHLLWGWKAEVLWFFGGFYHDFGWAFGWFLDWF